MKEKSVKKDAQLNLFTPEGKEEMVGTLARRENKALKSNSVVQERDPEKSTSEQTSSKVSESIFEHFKELTNEVEGKRIKAALQLLQQLGKSKESEKRQKELAYTLKRLVRGCGAATNISRAGFYIGLVGLLKTFDEREITSEQTFDTMQKELHVGTTIGNKEDADAIVGKILVCGALLQAGRLDNIESNELLERVINTLLQATKHRRYHASLGYAFLIEIVGKLNSQQFKSIVWPLLQIELKHSWPNQTLQTVHCLIAVQRQFPKVVNAKFLKAHFGNADLLQPESYQHLYQLFWEHGNMQLLTHPAFEVFAAYIATSNNLSDFWMQIVDGGLETSNKLRELITLKVATDLLNNNIQAQVADLLSINFMRMLVAGLKNQKQKKDEMVKAFYDDFFEALVACCTLLNDDVQLVAVIRRLILPPGLLAIEKYTSTRVVHQLINALGENGIKQIYTLYQGIFLDTQPKNISNASETWLNFERQNAGYMLQNLIAHKSVRFAYKWRERQLRFLLTCGIFHVNDAMEICKKEMASKFSKEFGEQCKNMFYTSVQSRLVDLQQEQYLLLKLVQYCNERMSQKHASKYFRIKQYNELLLKFWDQMFTAVCGNAKAANKKSTEESSQKVTAGGDNIELVFHILLLNMGLQLFREPEMAGPAIVDLLKCMHRVKEKHMNKQQTIMGSKKVTDATEAGVGELEWIEVIVDLFLHLLSQNASALRNIVDALFPHLCGSLSLTAIHQILTVLDMKDGHNPLSTRESDSEEEEEESEDGNEDEDGRHDISENNSKIARKVVNSSVDRDIGTEENDEEEGDDDDDDEDDDDLDDEDMDDEIPAVEKLRNEVSQVLMEHGGMPGAGDEDDDMSSIDLNDMTEEQGRKLDIALAQAFKAIRKPGGSAAVKKSKSYHVKVTTVLHFRIRVLDLIEIYLQQQPSLLIAIEIMIALYNMLPHCVGNELKPLQIKVEKVLQKLTALKCDIGEVKEEQLVAFIRLIVEQKSPAAAFATMNKLRNKCIVFLLNSANKIAAEKDSDCSQVLALCQEYVNEFLQSRNPTVNITLLSDIFRMRWRSVWDLGVALTRQGLTMQTRVFRRIQIYEILDILYKNHELQRLDADTTKQQLLEIENALCQHIKVLAANTNVDVSQKEHTGLLQLLLQSQKTNQRLQLNSLLADPEVGRAVQSMRAADVTQLYHRYCIAFKLPMMRTNITQKVKSKRTTEGTANTKAVERNVEENEAMVVENGIDHQTSKRKKRKKNNNQALCKLKKQKKEQRLQVASEGLNGGFALVGRQTSQENHGTDIET